MIDIVIAIIFFSIILIGPFVGFVLLSIHFAKENEQKRQLKIALYQATDYYKCTHIPMHIMESNDGKRGEYNLYKHLNDCTEDDTKFLFNLYLPYNNATTELDVVMINSSGIFVFESKNFSGWIFGNENSKNWCETFPNGEKSFFYNPVWQNKTHLNAIKNILGKRYKYHSAVVFGEQADLMDIDTSSDVLSIYDLRDYLHKKSVNAYLSKDEINQIYMKLYPYSQMGEEVKENHIRNIQNEYH